MATQNSKKLKKATTGKAKPAKGAVTRKPVKKAPVKAKAVTNKPRPAVKLAKGKNSVAPKSKAVAGKPVKAAKPKSKPVLASKAKPAVKKPVKGKAIAPVKGKAIAPVKSKAIAPVKAGKAPKSGAKTKSSKAVTKVAAPRKPLPVKATAAPKKVISTIVSAKAKTVVKTESKPKIVNKPLPVITKPKTEVLSKSAKGSKATDVTKKPTVSTSISSAKPKLASKPHPPVKIPDKHITESKVKPFVKMTEKKDFKPSTMVAAAEEPQKSRYTDKELEEFDQLIDQKLIVAREQLEFYLKQLEDMAENPDNKIKSLDDGLSTLESERVSSLASRQQKLIQHLENAKIRIKNKVYGICRETGKLISKERLRAVPHATLSIEAKQAQN